MVNSTTQPAVSEFQTKVRLYPPIKYVSVPAFFVVGQSQCEVTAVLISHEGLSSLEGECESGRYIIFADHR
jgi:hypothetical protein